MRGAIPHSTNETWNIYIPLNLVDVLKVPMDRMGLLKHNKTTNALYSCPAVRNMDLANAAIILQKNLLPQIFARDFEPKLLRCESCRRQKKRQSTTFLTMPNSTIGTSNPGF